MVQTNTTATTPTRRYFTICGESYKNDMLLLMMGDTIFTFGSLYAGSPLIDTPERFNTPEKIQDALTNGVIRERNEVEVGLMAMFRGVAHIFSEDPTEFPRFKPITPGSVSRFFATSAGKDDDPDLDNCLVRLDPDGTIHTFGKPKDGARRQATPPEWATVEAMTESATLGLLQEGTIENFQDFVAAHQENGNDIYHVFAGATLTAPATSPAV